MKVVVLLGPPGAGKGTLAKFLADRGYRHVSTGDLLRNEIKLETPLGLKAKVLLEQGKFVPDDTVAGMIQRLLANAAESSRFLFDGFPRTLAQAERLDGLMEALDGSIEAAFLLECPDEVIVKRLTGRRTCPTCGSVYHMAFNPPKHDQECDEDHCALAQRPDDQEETVRKRLKIYAEWTAPIVDFYSERNLIHAVDASKGIEEVRIAVAKHLERDEAI